MKLRRLRDGDVLEDGSVVLVRGGELDPDILCADAMRYHSIYGVYGISVFAVRDIVAAGMRLEPTGRNPRHFTVGFDDLEDGVQRLAACPHHVMPNAYHDA